LSAWESNMVAKGQQHCATATLDSTYYDAERVFYQIAAYTNNPATWIPCSQTKEAAYRNNYVIPNGGQLPGYWNFTKGMRIDFEQTGDTASQDAVILLSQKAAYARPGTLFYQIIDATLSREVSYSVMSYIDAEQVGNPQNPKLHAYIDVLLGHFDQWFVTKNYRCPGTCDPSAASNQYYIQPFMVGLGAEALIQYYEEVNPDPRIPAMLKIAADWMWAHAWDAPTKALWYQNWISDPALIPAGYWPPPENTAPDLNLLIAPVYAWLWRKTGDAAYRDRGDQVFVGGVSGAWLDGQKQFNQSYRWSFDFVKWRNGQ